MNRLLYLVLAVALLAFPAAAKPIYILIDPSGEHDAFTQAINSSGAVAGEFGAWTDRTLPNGASGSPAGT